MHIASHAYAGMDKERIPRRSGLVQLNGADAVFAIAAISQHPLLFSFLFDRVEIVQRVARNAKIHAEIAKIAQIKLSWVSVIPLSPPAISGLQE